MEKDTKEKLRKYVRLVLEGRTRSDVQISTGATVPWGSREHIMDLDRRIGELTMWRDSSQRGSDKRANYSRLITQIRSEKRAAIRHAEKRSGLQGG